MTNILLIAVTALVLTAAVTDFRRRRIPNWLTLGGVFLGLVLRTAIGGWAGLRLATEGMMLGFGIYFVLYLLRAMGAGDVKLMAAIGAAVGPSNWMAVFTATAVAAGAGAILLMVAKGRVRQTLWNVGYILGELVHFRPPYFRRSSLDVRDPGALTMPHGIAIAARHRVLHSGNPDQLGDHCRWVRREIVNRYCTAMVTAFDATSPTKIVTLTATPLDASAGTSAFTW